jgi:hypothetical protein
MDVSSPPMILLSSQNYWTRLDASQVKIIFYHAS